MNSDKDIFAQRVRTQMEVLASGLPISLSELFAGDPGFITTDQFLSQVTQSSPAEHFSPLPSATITSDEFLAKRD